MSTIFKAEGLDITTFCAGLEIGVCHNKPGDFWEYVELDFEQVRDLRDSIDKFLMDKGELDEGI
jgi:hypothetical protein